MNQLKWQRKRSRAHCLLFRGHTFDLCSIVFHVRMSEIPISATCIHYRSTLRLCWTLQCWLWVEFRFFGSQSNMTSLQMLGWFSLPIERSPWSIYIFYQIVYWMCTSGRPFTSFFVPHKINRSSTKHIKISSLLWGVLHVRGLMRPGVVFLQKLQERTEALLAEGKQVGSPGIMMT